MNKPYGKTAYNAYHKFAGGASLVTGHKLPVWEELSATVQDAWDTAAEATIARYDAEVRGAQKEPSRAHPHP